MSVLGVHTTLSDLREYRAIHTWWEGRPAGRKWPSQAHLVVTESRVREGRVDMSELLVAAHENLSSLT